MKKTLFDRPARDGALSVVVCIRDDPAEASRMTDAPISSSGLGGEMGCRPLTPLGG